MKTPFSIHNLVRARPPLTIEQLADVWTKRNVGAISEIAMRSMLDPPGTVYELPPLRIVGFAKPDDRITYQLKLHDAARAHRAKHVVEYAIGQHIEDLVWFCREELITALSTLDVCATFQRDQFAVREEQ